MFEVAKQGDWVGSNKLWFDQPNAELSKGHIRVFKKSIEYEWSFRGLKQNGVITFFGPKTSFRAAWMDSWHSKEMTDLHGSEDHEILKLYGTYADSQEIEWGWRIELDLRDPDVFQLRMFNVEPNGTIHIAVDLRGEREI